MKPSEFIQRLQTIAQDARHHPEPAVAVSLLAQLLLDLTLELEPLAKKYGALLQASGFLDQLEATVTKTSEEVQATAAPSSPAEPAAQVFPAEPVTLPVGYTVESATVNGDPATVTEIPATPAA